MIMKHKNIYKNHERRLTIQPKNTKRRKRDLNPRTDILDLLPFQGSPFNHLGISPPKKTERVGFEPTVPYGITSFQDWLLKPLGHLSLSKINKTNIASIQQKKYNVKKKISRYRI